MNSLVILLLIVAILLFIVSFFQKDRTSAVEKDVEELSLNLYQETYQLKKRMKVLEEEILIDTGSVQTHSLYSPKNEINAILKSQVVALYKQGLSLDQIAKQSALSISEVKENYFKHLD